MIDVVIMSKGESQLADRCLHSVLGQQNSKFQACIVTHLNGINRENEIQKSKAEWILFLDEDCLLPHPSYLATLQNKIDKNPKVKVWGGLYSNTPNATYSVEAYNSLCNFWVLISKDSEALNLLGGCLAFHVKTVKPLLADNPILWGGEDTYLLRHLQANKVLCRFSEDLSVHHEPSAQKISKIWNRGKLHGKSREQYKLQSRSYSLKSSWPELKKIHHWPFWGVHAAALAWGVATQRLALTDKFQQ